MKQTLAWTEYCKSLAPAIVETCAKVSVSSGPVALVKALGAALPEWKFRHALSRGGWYRLGGILDHQGERVSDNLESWVENALDERDGDFAALCDDFIDKKLYATRLVGQTHYLVASAGDSTDGFLQLEIEDLQEMRVHQLFANEPSTLEELVDPRGGADQPVPVGLPFYTFRRIQHIGAFLGRMLAQKPEPAPIHRMIDDWSKSSASNTSAYFNHWVIATREHLDRYHQPVFRAQPIATLAGEAPEFAAASGTTGLKLNEALSHFDRESGYPMAWYFHMLTSKAVPYWVAQAVVEDSLGGFAYLPQRDVDVVRHWLHQPYAL
ncbi:hypothetical protein AT959_01600 [Dechloromonas denitrificans]|uniref:Uncharacterized protein n=1 Tax=Dechloromonas denitrificans TaxID=281362 RepID=A0A133XNA1_9RHOO|nr:hypothetical protein [Dechloromonas denitrificans]KXB32413.1 hypothetical protein AT959_01600 [Dechloromonas denitrificans]